MDQNLTELNRTTLCVQILLELTPRQAQVLQHFHVAPDDTRVAKAMGISQHTVRNHLAAIMDKLGVGSRAELVKLVQDAKRRD